MGLGGMITGRSRSRYQKLKMEDEGEIRPLRRPGVKRRNGKIVGFRMSLRRQRFSWGSFPVILLPKKVVRIYAEILGNMKLDGVYPTILFTSQWGLPILSQPALASGFRRNGWKEKV